MDIIIRNIIDIDKRAIEIMGKTKQRIEESESETKDNIEKMKLDVINDAKIKADSLYGSIISQAKNEADKVRVISMEECKNLDNKFSDMKETLERKAFYKIFDIDTRDSRE